MLPRTVGFICLMFGAMLAGCRRETAPLPDGPAQIHFPQVTQTLDAVPVSADGQEVAFRFVNRGLSPKL